MPIVTGFQLSPQVGGKGALPATERELKKY
jgi:hypothetical protein